jgi:uncharacterized membrane protein
MSRLKKLATEHRVLLAIALGLAIATRLYDLGAESLWLDEAITFHRSRLPFGELIADAAKTYHNPAYFMFVHFWMTLGDSEFMLRLPSAVCGVFTIFFTFGIGRIAAGNWAGFGAALVLCLNPKALEYDQEARMYAPYSLGASIAMYGVIWLCSEPAEAAFPVWKLVKDRAARAAHRDAFRAWLGVLAGCVIALYCHATAVLFVTACSVVALVFLAVRPERREFLVNWIVVNLVVIALFSPWLPSLFTQTQDIHSHGFWIPEPTLERVYSVVRAVLMFGWRFPWLSAVMVPIALVGSFALRKRPLVLAALWLFTLLCPGLLLLASLRQPIFMPRLMLWAAIPFAVLLACGLTAPRWLAGRIACLAVFAGFAGFIVYRGYYVAVTKPRWRDAVQQLSDIAKPKVRILAIARRERRLIQYYFERESDPIPEFEYEIMEGSGQAELDAAISGAKTVWTIQGHQAPMASEIRSKLKAWGRQDDHSPYGEGVSVYKYVQRKNQP